MLNEDINSTHAHIPSSATLRLCSHKFSSARLCVCLQTELSLVSTSYSCWWTNAWVWRDTSWMGEKCCSTLMRWVCCVCRGLKNTVRVVMLDEEGVPHQCLRRIRNILLVQTVLFLCVCTLFWVFLYIFFFLCLSPPLRSPASVWRVWPFKLWGNTLWARQRLFRSRSMTTTNQVCLWWIF